MSAEVINVEFIQAKPLEEELLKAVKDVIYSFSPRITTFMVFGVLEMVKHDLQKELLS